MVTILPEDTRFKDMGAAIGRGIESFSNARNKNQDQAAIRNALESLGPDAKAEDLIRSLTSLDLHDPGSIKGPIENLAGAERISQERERLDLQRSKLDKPDKSNVKEEDRIRQSEAALKTVDRMREIRAEGRLGLASPVTKYFSGATRKNIGEYKRLGKSLIALASTIPIRNQKEFDVLSSDLFDTEITDDEAIGILDGMEKILRDSIGPAASKPDKKDRPPLSAFEVK